MRAAVAALLLVVANLALALPGLDYRSAGDNAILYDAPSLQGTKKFIIARGTPIEVILTQESWAKVRDSGGNMAWIEARLLAPARTLIVRADKADVRAAADDKSAIVFSAEKNVVLDFVETAAPGWAKVKHGDGQAGYVRASQVWGL